MTDANFHGDLVDVLTLQMRILTCQELGSVGECSACFIRGYSVLPRRNLKIEPRVITGRSERGKSILHLRNLFPLEHALCGRKTSKEFA